MKFLMTQNLLVLLTLLKYGAKYKKKEKWQRIALAMQLV